MILYSCFRLTLLLLGRCLFYTSSFPSWDLCFCTVPPAISLRSVFHSIRLSSQARFIVSPMSGASLSIFSLFVWTFILHRLGFDWFVCAVGQIVFVLICSLRFIFVFQVPPSFISWLILMTIFFLLLFLSRAVLLLESFKIFYFFFVSCSADFEFWSSCPRLDGVSILTTNFEEVSEPFYILFVWRYQFLFFLLLLVRLFLLSPSRSSCREVI